MMGMMSGGMPMMGMMSGGMPMMGSFDGGLGSMQMQQQMMQMQMQQSQIYMEQQRRTQENMYAKQRVVSGLQQELFSLMYRIQQAQSGVGLGVDLNLTGGYSQPGYPGGYPGGGNPQQGYQGGGYPQPGYPGGGYPGQVIPQRGPGVPPTR